MCYANDARTQNGYHILCLLLSYAFARPCGPRHSGVYCRGYVVRHLAVFCPHVRVRADLGTEPRNAEAARSTELLVRSLLLRPQRPAVLMLSSFSPQTQSEHGFYDAEVVHNTVARFYDVPHISVKGLIYHRYLLNSTQVSQTHFLDPILMNESGHTLLADAAIAYLQSEICAHIEAVHYDGSFHEHGTESLLDYESTESASPTEFAGDADIEHKDGSNAESDVPPFLMLDTPDGNWRSRDIVPYCFTANALLHPLPNDALRGTGWTREDAAGFDKKASWFSETPGSRLRIPIEVSAGDVSVRFSQQPIEQGYGRASCWVDDNSSGAVVLVGVTSGPEEVVRYARLCLDKGAKSTG